MTELPVAAIERGSVIDHIPLGIAFKIVNLLHLADHKKRVTIGLNLPSVSMGYKDLVKVEDRILSDDETSQIAVLAPSASINIIEDFKVVKKSKVTLPTHIQGLFKCLNPSCITNHESLRTHFLVQIRNKKVELRCHYCEKSFSYDSH